MMNAFNLDTPVFVRIVDAELLRSLDHGDCDEFERGSQDNINIVRYRSVVLALFVGHNRRREECMHAVIRARALRGNRRMEADRGEAMVKQRPTEKFRVEPPG
jgi:hypothetical protein